MEKSEVLSQRIERVRKEIRKRKVGALIIPRTEKMATVDVRYLSGFTGSMGFIVITRNRALIAVDSRYTRQATKEVRGGMDVVEWCNIEHRDEIIAKCVGRVRKVGLMAADVTVAFRDSMQENLASKELVSLPSIIANVRSVKSEEEIEKITRSLRATEHALEKAIRHIRPGVNELEVAEVFENAFPRSAKLAFESVVASGERSLEAHGVASDKLIEAGDVVQFDVGCAIDGYASDISRVAVCGTATDEQRRMHEAVLRAINDSLPLYRPGLNTPKAHNKAWETLDSLGYEEDKFGHSLGHGIGLNAHEQPVITGRAREDHITVFEEGQVASIEPGIYSLKDGSGKRLGFGMRIELDVVIRSDGPEVLDRLSTRLVETDKL